MSTKVNTNVGVADFSSRLVDACGTNEPAKIGRMLEVSYQTAKNYLEGRLPAAEVLITIAAATKVSLNWLLTGEGNKYTDAHSSSEKPSPPESQLQDKWAIRRGDLEMIMRAPAKLDVPIDPDILAPLGEALVQIQNRLEKATGANTSRRNKKK